MDTLYWVGEYFKLLAAFILLMFVWPSVVFAKHLKNKDKTYRFCFCATVQVLIVTTVVLLLGLCHILNRWVVFGIFYGIFAYAVIKRIPSEKRNDALGTLKRFLEGTYRFKTYMHNVGVWLKFNIKKLFRKLKVILRPHLAEYCVLGAIIIFAVIYFTYGVFQNYGYGASDMYVHHQWVDGLLDGRIFFDGIYPEGMHCVIYCLHVLFGIKLYSCVMLLADVQIIVTLIAAYLLLRKIFSWKFTPFFALCLFLFIDVASGDTLTGIARFQWTLPQEFGMFTEFIAVLYLLLYLRGSNIIQQPKHAKKQKYIWNDNLLIFGAAIAASAAIHFYCTIMALLLIIPFLIFNITRLFSIKKLVPLAVSLLCAAAIAGLPMGIAYASGIPLQGSLHWAAQIINGGEQKTGIEDTVNVEQAGDNESIGEKIGNAANIIYRKGYVALYNKDRADLFIGLTLFALMLWAVYKLVWVLPRIKEKNKKQDKRFKEEENYFNGYLPLITSSVFFMIVYTASALGLPQIIEGARVCSLENLLLMSVAVIPLDMIFALLCELCKVIVLKAASVAIIIGIYVFALFTGTYHGYLYNILTRYNSEVEVAESIINSYPPNSYTIVSSSSELYQVNRYGRHEELLTFINEIKDDEYFIPTEYVFVFVEKRPLIYAQPHFYLGPNWLASNKYSGWWGNASVGNEVYASVITAEDAKKSAQEFENNFSSYKNIERRTIIESKAYQWCRKFTELFPYEMSVYYEDDNFVCYCFRQNPQSLYNLAIDDWDEINGEEWAIEI